MTRLLATTAVVALGMFVAPLSFAQNQPVGPGQTAAAAKDALNQEDKMFVKEAAIGGMAEVEMSKIAQKSENAEVKSFADRMVRDHTAANTQLTATVTGLGADMPKSLDSEHERMRD